MNSQKCISLLLIVWCLCMAPSTGVAGDAGPVPGQGVMAGEVTATSVILQARLTATDTAANGDHPGLPGTGRFELSTSRWFTKTRATGWLDAVPNYDYILKTQVSELQPGTRYYYRLQYGSNRLSLKTGPTASFRTLGGPDVTEPVSFVVVTGMNYAFFHHGDYKGKALYTGRDKHLGYQALRTIRMLRPDFFIGTGDNVYYDHFVQFSATTPETMRKKWHEQFRQPRFIELFRDIPAYWEKDDHDHRYNDNDNTGDKPPASDLGIRIFREQVPVTDPADGNARTYRTHRINSLLQIWLTEGRDYRSPNAMPDGPEKTLWGAEQKAWLKRTLQTSDAPFKILISPTPLIGPDDAYKTDNHVNHGGFRHEGDEFFRWLQSEGFLLKNFYILCGDRHWQYHSINPTGFEELSTGALVDANSRLGRKPGDPKSTDPDALITQPYMQDPASGGFLHVSVVPGTPPQLVFTFFDENGVVLYTHTKTAY